MSDRSPCRRCDLGMTGDDGCHCGASASEVIKGITHNDHALYTELVLAHCAQARERTEEVVT